MSAQRLIVNLNQQAKFNQEIPQIVSHQLNKTVKTNYLQDFDRWLVDYLTKDEQQLGLQNSLCYDALRYHFSTGGRYVRARLCYEASLSLNLNYSDATIISAACELLHNASLIHDDIQDGDYERRGVQTVWKKFGKNIALCTGDLMIAAAFGVLAQFSKLHILPRIMTTLIERTSQTIHGQCADLNFHTGEVVDVETYKQIVIAKSGALLSLPLELAMVASGYEFAQADAKLAAESLAIAYQILDDLTDIDKDTDTLGNPKALNIYFVLKANIHTEFLMTKAKLIALESLNLSMLYANQLPKNSGEALIDLANSLKQTLTKI